MSLLFCFLSIVTLSSIIYFSDTGSMDDFSHTNLIVESATQPLVLGRKYEVVGLDRTKPFERLLEVLFLRIEAP